MAERPQGEEKEGEGEEENRGSGDEGRRKEERRGGDNIKESNNISPSNRTHHLLYSGRTGQIGGSNYLQVI